MKPVFLRCEYLVGPLGIDVAAPRLSWLLCTDSTARDQQQTTYRILVASTPQKLAREQGDLWDSGRVASNRCNQIVYAGKPLTSRMACHWKVRIWNHQNRTSVWSAPATFTIGLMQRSDWQAQWIGAPPEQPYTGPGDPLILPSPLLRKTFYLKKTVKHALIYVTARGIYRLYLNGQRVGDHELAPEWTDYRRRIQYQTFDVTELLSTGKNALTAMLADGWYAGRIGPVRWDKTFPKRGGYGRDRRLLVQLEITFADGSVERVLSDESWKLFADGPIRRADNFLGETHDARKIIADWKAVEFDDREWPNVCAESLGEVDLVAQKNEPIRVIKTVKPIAISEPAPDKHVFDLGQNMVGWCRLDLSAKQAAKVVLRHGEVLNADGTVHTDNLGSATQTDVFLSDGRPDAVFEPLFTYHGFRFVEVAGLQKPPDLQALQGKVLASSCRETSAFACSNPLLDQIFENTLWSQRGNMHSVPTDCPQRDERMGWTGDAQVFAQTAIFNMDMAAFYSKWLTDLHDAQASDGRYPDFAPHPYQPEKHFNDAPGWGDAGIIVPWRLYENYGDTRILERHFEANKRYLDHILARNPNYIWENCSGNKYGDWLNGDTINVAGYPRDGGKVPFELFATAMWAQSVDLFAKIAGVLGQEGEKSRHEKLAQNIRIAFNRAFVDTDGKLTGDTQAGYALALHLDLLPEKLRPAAVEHLLRALEKYDWRISTGFISTIMLMKVLTRFGHHEVAYRLIESRRCPSWGYCIEQGATTMWERWDAYVAGRGIQTSDMNSFNHYAFGSVAEWMFRTILGFNPDAEKPGYAHIILRPSPGDSLTWARGHYDSIRGRIAVAWRLEDGQFHYDIEIPAGSTATLYLPSSLPENALESSGAIAAQSGIELVQADNHEAIFHLTSGAFAFSTPMGVAG